MKKTKKVAPKKAAKKAVKKVAKKTATKKVAPKKGKLAVKKAAKRAQAITKKTVTTTTTVTTTISKVSPKETHYLLVLDESTSMGPVRGETLSGLNEQIKTIKNLDKKYPKQKYFISIVKFSTNVSTLIENVPASQIKELKSEDYMPNGWTALHDAIGMGINNLKNRIESKLKTGEASALVVILTDGEENRSTEFNASKIKALVTELEATGMWTFAFIGANQDSVLTADNLGFNRSNTVNYAGSSVGTTLAFATLSSAMGKRAAYTTAGVYGATTSNFMSSVTAGSASIGEDASLLDLSGTISTADIENAKKIIEDKDGSKTNK